MREQPVKTPVEDAGEMPPSAAHAGARQVRRTMLSTGFSAIPGKTCGVCGFQGFRWQTECPAGHKFG